MSGKVKEPSSWHILGKDLKQWMLDHAFAIGCALLFLIANIAHSIWKAAKHIHADPNGHSLSFSRTYLENHLRPGAMSPKPKEPGLISWIMHTVESLVFVHGILLLIIYFLLILVILSVAQSHLGAWRTVGTSIVTALLGSFIGLGICYLVSQTVHGWIRLDRIPILLSPLTLIIGPLMAESAFESVLWKRRIVLISYTFVGTLLLFSGNPGDYCNLAAAVVGHVMGLMMHGRDGERVHWQRGTDYEIRRLFAFAQVVLAIGPILSITSTSRFGLLTTMGLFTSSLLDGSSFVTACGANQTLHSCIIITGQHSVALLGLWLHILLPVAALGLVAWGLYHGRKAAAWTSIAVNGLVVLFTIVYYVIFPLTITTSNMETTRRYATMPAFVVTALPSLLLIIFMTRELAHFQVPTGKTRVRTGLGAMVASLIATSAVYALFALSWPSSFFPKPTVKLLALDMLRRILPLGFGGRQSTLIRPRTMAATLIGTGMTVIFWLTVLIVFIFWFRDNISPDAQDRTRANSLVELGGDSMSFMTTWEDNHYWFSPTGRSAIAYRVMHSIALTVTGPFGARDEYMRDLDDFTAYCDEHGWSPAFYAVHEDQKDALQQHGFSSIQVGTEMVIDPNAWQTRGHKWQDIRTAINKAKRDGIVDVLCTYDSAGFDVQQQIVEISEQWAQLKALPEMKFTLGGVEELRDPRVALLYAIDSKGVVLGVTSWLPTYRNGKVIGWTLDFMRHRTDSPNGIMEFLIARMAERLRDEGASDPEHAVEFMSLSAAPLAGMGEGRGKTVQIHADATGANETSMQQKKAESVTNETETQPAASKQDDRKEGPDLRNGRTSGTEIIEHALQIVADVLEPAYGFKSLFFFKRKFQPTPAPVYICYPDSSKLAQIGITVVSAYVPELKPNQVVDVLKTMTEKKDETKEK